MAKYYATTGINWEFLFEVVYEDDCILILQDIGRFHRFDQSRMFPHAIAEYIDLNQSCTEAHGAGWHRLAEVRPEKRA